MSLDTTPINIEQFKEAIQDISIENCRLVKSQLQNSISKLFETNLELKEEIDTIKISLKDDNDGDKDNDINLYLQVIGDNVPVLADQISRVFAINDLLVARGVESSEDMQKEKNEFENRLEKHRSVLLCDTKENGKATEVDQETVKEGEDARTIQEKEEVKAEENFEEGVYL